MRKWSAVILNILAPGAGLVILRREWLGILLAVAFACLGLTGLWGWLLIPLVIPSWLAKVSLAAAVLLWIWSQWLLLQRVKVICSPQLQQELRAMCERAAEAIAREELDAAYQTLLVAMALDDESAEVNARWADLMARMGRFDQARRAWRRVLRLSREGAYRGEAVKALKELSG
jgi:hypothetical protein